MYSCYGDILNVYVVWPVGGAHVSACVVLYFLRCVCVSCGQSNHFQN
jgi:hypothetical protein